VRFYTPRLAQVAFLSSIWSKRCSASDASVKRIHPGGEREDGAAYCVEEQLELINRELTHRISHLFAIATSICQQTIRQGGTGEQVETAIGARLRALATAQRLLDVTSRRGAELRTLVLQVLEPLAPASDKLVLHGPEIHLPVAATTPFALVHTS
jgi:two-component sensor histidine kinase